LFYLFKYFYVYVLSLPRITIIQRKKNDVKLNEVSDPTKAFYIFLYADVEQQGGKVIEATSHTFRIRRKFHESNVGNTRSTGLEPATSAVTGRCSNQLNYDPIGGYDTFKSEYSQF
jgi:hypothetical protein